MPLPTDGRGLIVDGRGSLSGQGLTQTELQEANWVDETGYLSTVTDYDESGDGDSLRFNTNGTNVTGRQGYHATFTAAQYSSLEFWYNEENVDANGFTLVVTDSNGNDIVGAGTDSPEWTLVTGDYSGRYPDSGTGNFNSTRVRFNFDWANNQVDVQHYEFDGSPSAGVTNEAFINTSAADIARLELYSTSYWKGGSASPNNWVDYWQLFPDSTFTI